MIERTLTIDNAEKFCTYILTHQFNARLGRLINSLVGSIAESIKFNKSLIQVHLSHHDFNSLTNYLSSINKGEIQMVERSVQGNWQLFLDELLDDCDIPF